MGAVLGQKQHHTVTLYSLATRCLWLSAIDAAATNFKFEEVKLRRSRGRISRDLAL
jgi:DNA-binding transcriptional regulator WhiA